MSKKTSKLGATRHL